MIYHEGINRPAHVETYHEGGFFVVEWSDENTDLGKMIEEEFGEDEWIERYGSKEKFLKAFIGIKNGIYFLWLSNDAATKHSVLFTSIPSNTLKHMVACGEILKDDMSFELASTTLYEKGFLNREESESWINENLPAWI